MIVQIDGEYYLYKDMTQLGNETVEFDGQLFKKADLSKETLEWLEWYNSLPIEEQLAVNSIPADLYTNDNVKTIDSGAEE